MEGLDVVVEALAALAVAHPRAAGVLLAVGLVLSVVGVVCAQIDTAALERAGHPQLAKAVRIGAHLGAFALRLLPKKGAVSK
jgi:hypothetical protein